MTSASRAGQSVQRRDVCKTFISYIQEIQNGAMVARAVVRENFVTTDQIHCKTCILLFLSHCFIEFTT